MKRQLSQGEKLVLFALAEDGRRTDAEVAERVGVKESTARRHRRSLMRDKQLSFVNFPSLNLLGIDFIAEFFGRTSPAIPAEERNEIYKGFFERNPQVFDSVAGEGFIMATAAFASFSDILLFEERHDAFFEDIPSSKSFLKMAIFPFDLSRCFCGYNFAPCIHRILGLDLPHPEAIPLKALRRGKAALSKIETRALVEMLESPTAPDAEIAQKIRRSRQSVTEMRKDFLEQELIKRIAVPKLLSPEFGAVAYAHLRFKPGATFEKKVSVAGDEWWRQSCYMQERNMELFSVYPFGNFREYTDLMNAYTNPFQKAGILDGEPEIYVISQENIMDIVDCSFAPLVRETLS